MSALARLRIWAEGPVPAIFAASRSDLAKAIPFMPVPYTLTIIPLEQRISEVGAAGVELETPFEQGCLLGFSFVFVKRWPPLPAA